MGGHSFRSAAVAQSGPLMKPSWLVASRVPKKHKVHPQCIYIGCFGVCCIPYNARMTTCKRQRCFNVHVAPCLRHCCGYGCCSPHKERLFAQSLHAELLLKAVKLVGMLLCCTADVAIFLRWNRHSWLFFFRFCRPGVGGAIRLCCAGVSAFRCLLVRVFILCCLCHISL